TCKCFCRPPTEECGAKCVDLRYDWWNCGLCGRHCASNESCCGGACVDLSKGVCWVDHGEMQCQDCGACGVICPLGRFCTAGRCTCPPGQFECAGECCPEHNLCCDGKCIGPSHPGNCGACGVSCDLY